MSLYNGIDMANLNAPKQIVVSGVVDQLDAVEQKAKDAGAQMAIRLKVSGAFHSRYMKPLAEEFSSSLSSIDFNTFDKPVIANVSAKAYSQELASDYLLAQLYSSVRWVESIKGLIDQGVQDFVEVGPGRVLKGLLRHIERG